MHTYTLTAENDESLGNTPGTSPTLNVTTNDTGDLNPGSVRIMDGTTPVTELVVTGEGTWTVSPTGEITFTPETGYTGDPTPIEYQVAYMAGLTTTATVTITYTTVVDPPSPTNPSAGGTGDQAVPEPGGSSDLANTGSQTLLFVGVIGLASIILGAVIFSVRVRRAQLK